MNLVDYDLRFGNACSTCHADGAALGAGELGRTLADAVATKRPDPGIDAFHRRYEEKFADVVAGPRPERPPDHDARVDRTRPW